MSVDWKESDFSACIERVKAPCKIPKKNFLSEGPYPIVSQEQELINGFWLKKEDVFLCPKPIVVFGDHTKVIKFVDFDFVVGADGVKILKPKSFLFPKFFYYCLKSLKIESLGYARHFKLLKKKKIRYPSIPEQKRIAAVLDDAFERIDAAIANTEKNITNARELFESYLNGVFSRKGKGWEEKTLGDVCENFDKKRIPITKSKREPGSIPYYGASGIVDYVKDYIFDEGLLLVSEDGANLLARTYPIAFSILGKTWVNNHAHVLRFNDMRFQRFIEYYLNSISLAPYVSGMAQPKLNQKQLNSIPVPVPNIEDQGYIVSSLDALYSKAQQLKDICKQKSQFLAELKQSILKRAFSGELDA